MCPACLTTLTLIAAGTTTTGGVTAIAMKTIRWASGGKNIPTPSKETRS